MSIEDKLYNKIKNAAENTAQTDFPGMDKVWSRIENKMDTNVLKKENTRWKKIAVAASVLVVGTIAFQFYSATPEFKQVENNIVVLDTVTDKQITTVPQVATTEKPNPIIKENAAEIVAAQTQLNKNTVAIQEEKESAKTDETLVQQAFFEEITTNDVQNDIQSDDIESEEITKTPRFKPNTKGAENEDFLNSAIARAKSDALQEKKLAPLVVIDGEASKNTDLNQIPEEELDSVIMLSEPLYIINGIQYSEKELFGPNPTSPYAPLHKQNIISTTILQEEDALKEFGEKGKKGVVIIKTKNGKPKK